jgi:L-fuconolactonase
MTGTAERKKPQVHPVNEEWLALGAEAAIGPEIDVVDSHIHLWDFSDPPYFADSYCRDAASAGIGSSVYVDCTMGYRESGPAVLEPVGEVEFAVQQAADAAVGGVDVATGIIGWADLTLGDAAGDVLDALAQACARARPAIPIRSPVTGRKAPARDCCCATITGAG